MVDEIQILDSFGDVLKTYKVPLGRSEFEGASWEGVTLYDAQLNGKNFMNANLYWAGFFKANLDGANFENAVLQGVNLNAASCLKTNFRGANLGQDNLGGSSSLQGTDLTGAILNHAIFTGAQYDDETVFPKGFSPKSHGMVNVSD